MPFYRLGFDANAGRANRVGRFKLAHLEKKERLFNDFQNFSWNMRISGEVQRAVATSIVKSASALCA